METRPRATRPGLNAVLAPWGTSDLTENMAKTAAPARAGGGRDYLQNARECVAQSFLSKAETILCQFRDCGSTVQNRGNRLTNIDFFAILGVEGSVATAAGTVFIYVDGG